ncbi:MAG: type II toxin-antitoxin system prevent-host-death family antitoxin, partial [Mariprofundaceae bacterium]
AMKVAVRELKDHLSEYLRRAAAGEEVVITSHGRPVARLTPVVQEESEEAVIERLRAQPWIRPGKGGKLKPVANPVPWKPGDKKLSDIVLEDRE